MTDARIRLISIAAEIHVHSGIFYWERPLRIGLHFAGRDFLRIREQRGDGISFDALPLEAADLSEGGRIEVHDVTDRLDPSLRGAPIAALHAVGEDRDRLLGVVLDRAGGAPFCIWIDDDEFYWGSEADLKSSMHRRGIDTRTGREVRP